MSSFVEDVIAKAQSQLGVQEEPKGSNSGPRVSEYQRVTGYDFPVPWCLCFLYWCTEKVGNASNRANPVLKTGDCDTLLSWARRNDMLFTTPQRGDFGLVLASESDAIHVFLVEEVHGGTITTIEGNTNNDGSREGYAVLRRTRNVSGKLRFVRWGRLTQTDEVKYSLSVNGASVGEVTAVQGVSLAPVRKLATALGVASGDIGWDNENQGVEIKGQLVPATPVMKDGAAYVPLRALVNFVNPLVGKNFQIAVAGNQINITG